VRSPRRNVSDRLVRPSELDRREPATSCDREKVEERNDTEQGPRIERATEFIARFHPANGTGR
jgi:hypothetical protein